MKSFRKKIQAFFIILSLSLLAFSCKRADDNVGDKDPIVGNWKIAAISNGNQSQNVSNLDCWNLSRGSKTTH